MDNISKDNLFFRIIHRCTEVILFVMPICADLLGVASFFIDNIQIWIANNIGQGISVYVIFGLMNLIFIANIIFVVERVSKDKQLHITLFISGYKSVLKKYSEYLDVCAQKCENAQSMDEVDRIICECLKVLIDEVSVILSEVTNEKIRVCIKCFPKRYASKQLKQMELMTFCRSDMTLYQSSLERTSTVKVVENTDFKLIMENKYPYFVFNGLTNYKKETGEKYRNSTIGWDKKYNATIVHPIYKTIGYQRNGKANHEILGFICADTLSTRAFVKDVGRACNAFIESVSFLLYVFLEKSISFRAKFDLEIAG